jgi:hypothetical protein
MQILLIECLHFFMEDNMAVTDGRNGFVKKWIEFLWSVMGGLLFSILASIRTGEGRRFFETGKWLHFDQRSGMGSWDGFGQRYYWDEFFIGFIFTFILVKSIKKYRSLK